MLSATLGQQKLLSFALFLGIAVIFVCTSSLNDWNLPRTSDRIATDGTPSEGAGRAAAPQAHKIRVRRSENSTFPTTKHVDPKTGRKNLS